MKRKHKDGVQSYIEPANLDATTQNPQVFHALARSRHGSACELQVFSSVAALSWLGDASTRRASFPSWKWSCYRIFPMRIRLSRRWGTQAERIEQPNKYKPQN